MIAEQQQQIHCLCPPVLHSVSLHWAEPPGVFEKICLSLEGPERIGVYTLSILCGIVDVALQDFLQHGLTVLWQSSSEEERIHRAGRLFLMRTSHSESSEVLTPVICFDTRRAISPPLYLSPNETSVNPPPPPLKWWCSLSHWCYFLLELTHTLRLTAAADLPVCQKKTQLKIHNNWQMGKHIINAWIIA